jgi:hypothetical protein
MNRNLSFNKVRQISDAIFMATRPYKTSQEHSIVMLKFEPNHLDIQAIISQISDRKSNEQFIY